MAYGTINVDTVTTSTTGGVLGAGNASIMKNRIINGAMTIDQRNAGASTTITADVYTLDRWQAVVSQTSKFSVQQNAGSITPPTGFNNYLGVTSLSAYSVISSDYLLIRQAVEGYNAADLGWGTANAKTVTLSFWVYSSLTGTFGGSIQNSNFTRSYPFNYTVSSANTWTQISVTVAGDTSGTWLKTNGIGVYVSFSLGMGSTYTGTANAWAGANYVSPTGATSVVGTNGATFYITGVQLEVGSSATGFEYRQYGTELALCQRYFELAGFGATAIANTSTQFASIFQYKVSKRATPTASLTVTSNVRYRQFGTADRDATTASVDSAYYTTEGANVFIGGFSGLPTSSVAAVNYTTSSNSGNLIAFSAEL